ncbi:hypothetical protein HDV00_000943, partial [Rhizophlyctis rosea]
MSRVHLVAERSGSFHCASCVSRRSPHELTQLQPGGYQILLTTLHRRVSHLLSANLTPTFIFDGPLPKWKFFERIKRDTQRISSLESIIPEVASSEANLSTYASTAANLLPPFAIPACIELLKEMNVDVLVANGEADRFIAAMAREKRGYILSRDSDFFIYDLGISDGDGVALYVPLDTLQICQEASGLVIKARAYSRQDMATFLGVPPILLPAFATMVGCDAIAPEDRKLVDELIPNLNASAGAHVRIREVAKLLNSFPPDSSPSSVIEAVTETMKDEAKREKIRTTLSFAAEQYLVDSGRPSLTTVNSPEVNKMMAGNYSHKLVEVSQGRLFWCIPFLEDVRRASAWDLSRSIRTWIYALVAWSAASTPPPLSSDKRLPIPYLHDADFAKLSLEPLNWEEYTKGPLTITEYIRRATRMATETVPIIQQPLLESTLQSLYTTAPPPPHPIVTQTTFATLPPDVRSSLYLHVLQSNTERIRALPEKYVPLAACARFVVREMKVKGHAVADFELVAWIASGVKAVILAGGLDGVDGEVAAAAAAAPPPWTPTRVSLHLLAQIECTLFSAFLLAQAVWHPGLEEAEGSSGKFGGWHWKCVDPSEFHRCMSVARGGGGVARLFGEGNVGGKDFEEFKGAVEMVREAVLGGLEGEVERGV